MRTLTTLVLGAVFAGAALADPPTATSRAKQLVDAQLVAIGKDRRAESLAATFDSDAVVFETNRVSIVGKGFDDYPLGTLFALTPHVYLTKAKLKALSAGGNASAVWITADITTTYYGGEPEFGQSTSTLPLRITELLAADGASWKVVAGHLSFPSAATSSAKALPEIPSFTDAGPLAALVISPAAIDAALSKDPAVTVLGTDPSEHAIGPVAAHKLLGAWKKLHLELDGKVREVRTKTWGFAEANVNLVVKGKDPVHMRALLIALPNDDGTWSVVSVHYSVRQEA